jgi:glycosyltransferase involved in cell wall biosynthesis
MTAQVDILIPTLDRSAALAVMLTSLLTQSFQDFRILISDQSEGPPAEASGELAAVRRVLEMHGIPVRVERHLPRRGMAEQRQFLLDQSSAPYVLYLDDDLILEPYALGNMLQVLRQQGCGFAGTGLIGLSFANDVRPHEQAIEFWEGRVQPEQIIPGSPAWDRYRLHNAANLLHVQNQLQMTPERPRAYKVAWVGGCVLYDAEKLRRAGAFRFWRDLPDEHAGEDVLAQLRVMARFGGCGVLPSGVYHQELPTTIANRQVDAPRVLNPFAELLGE